MNGTFWADVLVVAFGQTLCEVLAFKASALGFKASNSHLILTTCTAGAHSDTSVLALQWTGTFR
jgi:hypothetical protein